MDSDAEGVDSVVWSSDADGEALEEEADDDGEDVDDAEEEGEEEAVEVGDADEDCSSEEPPVPSDEDGEDVDVEEVEDPFEDEDSSETVGDGVGVGFRVGRELPAGASLREVSIMSRTTESVPRPRVTSSTTPADRRVATSALTTATIIAIRRVRADREDFDALPDRRAEDPRTARFPVRRFAATAGREDADMAAEPSRTSGRTSAPGTAARRSVGSVTDAEAPASAVPEDSRVRVDSATVEASP